MIISQPHLELTTSGIFFIDGKAVTHIGMRNYLFRHLQRAMTGQYGIAVGANFVPVEIADTPFFIHAVDIGTNQITLHLLGDLVAIPDLTTLEQNGEHILYVTIVLTGDNSTKRHQAKFSRQALQQLAPLLVESAVGEVGLCFCGVMYSIGRR